jgi:hypothetical protein
MADREETGALGRARERAADDGTPALLALESRRSPTREQVAVHESGHVIAARVLNLPVAGATIVPGADFGGRVWSSPPDGSDLKFSLQERARGIEEICQRASRLRPRDGENFDDAESWYLHVYKSAVESMAGLEAECLEGVSNGPTAQTDYLVTIDFARAEAAALLTKHRTVLRALADALLNRETLTGEEMDRIIFAELVRSDQASEAGRRGAWRAVLSRADEFRSQIEDLAK